jgi:hypothetical protein
MEQKKSKCLVCGCFLAKQVKQFFKVAKTLERTAGKR